MTHSRLLAILLLGVGAIAAGIYIGGCSANYGTVRSAAVVSTEANSMGALPPTPSFPPGDDEELWVIEKPPAASPSITARAIGDIPIGAGAMLNVLGTRLTPLTLERSEINARIDGAIASVDLHQHFINPSDTASEAAYAFPLPRGGVVSEFVMSIGSRHIRGIVREAGEAEKIYREAQAAHLRTSLIVQKSPGVFLQHAANIQPHQKIDVEIRYVHTVIFRDGSFEFACPMTLRPADGSAPTTFRSGREIALSVMLTSHIPLDGIESPSHVISVDRPSPRTASITLLPGGQIPNSDFILRYKLESKSADAQYSYEADGGDGTFALLVLPPTSLENIQRQPTAIALDWHGDNVHDVFPNRALELYSGHPLLVIGRYRGSPPRHLTVGDRKIDAHPIELGSARQPLACLWARRKIASLLADPSKPPEPQMSAEVRKIALEYGVESPYTSFIVVDAATRLSSNDARP